MSSSQMPADLVSYCRRDLGEDLDKLSCLKALLRFEGIDQVHKLA